MCEYCKKPFGEDIIVQESPCDKQTQSHRAEIMQTEGDTAGIVLFRYGLAQGWFNINYCPMCGERLS